MKIVFVNPPTPKRGYGVYREECCVGLPEGETVLPAMLAWLAGIARRRHKVAMVDFVVEPNIMLPKADLYVLSASPFLLRRDLQISRHIKKLYPTCKIAVVVQPPVLESWIMSNYPVDVFIGFPRIQRFMELVQVSQDNKSALDLLPLEKYTITPIYNGLGCPYHCIFCGWGRQEHSYRNMDLVLQESLEVAENAKSNEVYFLDPNIPFDRDWALSFAEEIGNRFQWHIDARVDRRDVILLKTLANNGCSRITYGAETVEPHLKTIGKGIKQSWVYEAAINACLAGLRPHFTFLFGFPWDSLETKKMLIAFTDKLRNVSPNVSTGINCLFPYPGTKLFQMVKDSIAYPNLVEMFESQAFGLTPVFPTNHLTIDQVKQVREEIRYHYHRRKILDYVKHPKIRYIRDVPRLLLHVLKRGE